MCPENINQTDKEELLDELKAALKSHIKEESEVLKSNIKDKIEDLIETLNPTGQPQEVFCPKPWRIVVNDRYQKGVTAVASLATAALLLPIVFLKDIYKISEGATIISEIDNVVVWGWVNVVLCGWSALAISIASAFIYHFFSAKYMKVSWGRDAAFLWGLCGFTAAQNRVKGRVFSEKPLERVLDISHGVMILGFLIGVFCMMWFMVHYQPKDVCHVTVHTSSRLSPDAYMINAPGVLEKDDKGFERCVITINTILGTE